MNRKPLYMKIMIYTALVLFSGWCLFPLFVIISTSLGPNLVPLIEGAPFLSSVSMQNYIDAWTLTDMPLYLKNTLIVSISSTLISVFLSVSAGYALARFKFKGKNIIARWILCMRMVPALAFVVPIFVIFLYLKLLDTHISLIIVYATFLMPFSIWLLMSFIKEVPPEAEESALVDGLSRFQVIYKVVLPQIWPAIGVVSLLSLISAWKEFIFAMTLAPIGATTMSVGMAVFVSDRGDVEWGRIMAAAVITMIIPMIISIVVNRYLMKGISFGSSN